MLLQSSENDVNFPVKKIDFFSKISLSVVPTKFTYSSKKERIVEILRSLGIVSISCWLGVLVMMVTRPNKNDTIRAGV